MKIFVGCSSRNEIDKKYLDLAIDVGKKLLSHELVIGGTRVGMMGNVASVFDDEKITHIILKDYVEEGFRPTNQVLICETSFERMKCIYDMADAFLFLPGGTGTLGEIITFLEENRMKQEKKKLIILNYEHFFDDIVSFIQKIKKEQFSNEEILEGLIFIDKMEELERKI